MLPASGAGTGSPPPAAAAAAEAAARKAALADAERKAKQQATVVKKPTPAPAAAGGRMLMRAYGGFVPGRGGMVPGFGNRGVPAMLHGGEYVLNSKAVQNIGMAALQVMNNLRFSAPKGYSGGSGGMTTVNNTENINIYVDTFIGEEKWFESMMSDYNMKVQPNIDKRRGRQGRTVTAYV